ncbi:MAG: DNA polymerase III subunit delta [Actinomycetota bacterium]|nr:DNA polymerase III subunit delta [Actinomycetota bacterium]
MSHALKPVYLLTGSDRPKVGRALGRLRARFDEGAIETLAAAEASGEDAVAACNALGLLAAKGRLVLVSGVDDWKAADVKAIAAYLEDPAPATVLVLVAEGLKRDSPLAKACAPAGDVLAYDVSKRDLARWVRDQFRRVGVEIDSDASRALLEIVGDDVHALEGEIEKVAAWAGDDPVDERTIELLAVPHADPPLFALTDAWGARDPSALMAACEAVLERSPDPISKSVPRLVGTLTSHVARVIACHALAAEGVRARDAAAQLKLHPFVAEKAFAHARNYSRQELENVVVRLASLDLALKGASGLPIELELERALVDVTVPDRVPQAG